MNSTQQAELLFNRRQLFKLLWPIQIENLLTVFVGMVDVLMIAYVGEVAMAGVSLVDTFNLIVLQILLAMTNGGTVVTAQCIGARDKKQASRSIGQLLLLTLCGMGLITLFLLTLGDAVLQFFFSRVEPAVMHNASVYLAITACSWPFMALYNTGAAAFRAQGNTRVAMLVSLLMNVVNVAGNAVGIFVLHLGVVGVAVPTTLARVLAGAVIMVLLQTVHNADHVKLQGLSDLVPERKLLGRILSVGVPLCVENGFFESGKIILQSLVASLGTASIAAFAVANSLVTYLYLPGNALGAGLLTIVGQCYGAKKPEQGQYYIRLLLKVNYAILLVLCVILIGWQDFWVDLYHLSGEAHVLAVGLLVSHCWAMILWPVGFLTPYYFRAIGRARFTMVVAISCMWIFRIGFAYIFIKYLGLNVLGIWYGMYVDWVVRIFVYGYALHKQRA